MNDFTVLHGNELDYVTKLQSFYNQVRELVEANEQYSDSISLILLKEVMRKHFPDSN